MPCRKVRQGIVFYTPVKREHTGIHGKYNVSIYHFLAKTNCKPLYLCLSKKRYGFSIRTAFQNEV